MGGDYGPQTTAPQTLARARRRCLTLPWRPHGSPRQCRGGGTAKAAPAPALNRQGCKIWDNLAVGLAFYYEHNIVDSRAFAASTRMKPNLRNTTPTWCGEPE